MKTRVILNKNTGNLLVFIGDENSELLITIDKSNVLYNQFYNLL